MPDTTGPFIAAYTITALVYVGYAFHLWRRTKRVRERLKQRGPDSSLRSE